MEKKLKKAFHLLKEEHIDLTSKIWLKIQTREKRIAKIKTYIFLFTGVSSLVGLFPVGKILISDFIKSGIYEYISLLSSNGNSLLSYWKELMLSIAESLPTTSIILSLSLVFVLFLSFKYAIKYIINSTQMDDQPDGGKLSLSF